LKAEIALGSPKNRRFIFDFVIVDRRKGIRRVGNKRRRMLHNERRIETPHKHANNISHYNRELLSLD